MSSPPHVAPSGGIEVVDLAWTHPLGYRVFQDFFVRFFRCHPVWVDILGEANIFVDPDFFSLQKRTNHE